MYTAMLEKTGRFLGCKIHKLERMPGLVSFCKGEVN